MMYQCISDASDLDFGGFAVCVICVCGPQVSNMNAQSDQSDLT